MKSFDEVLSDINQLKGIELSSLSGTAKKIKVTQVDYSEKRIDLSVEGGSTDTRSFEEIGKIYDALRSGNFVHVESILNGSGSSRNRPETLLASLPYIDWGQYKGKKCLIYRERNTHKLGTTNKLTPEEVNELAKTLEPANSVKENGISMYTPFRSLIFNTDVVTERFDWNRIIFGAPGTGKSWQINADKNELLKNGGEFERVTFHPDYTYSQFVGAYKPTTDENGEISYQFVPGPFMRVYVNALKNGRTDNPQPYLLIIEEINRARVASVFGDIFQLLDRKEDGTSQYAIQASEDIKKYLAAELGGQPSDYPILKLPNNMFIWASMNSADQGVYPMDTAFKRRWDFEYLGIDDNQDKIKCTVNLVKGDPESNVSWNRLRKAINAKLLDVCRVNEDKLLGPFFLSQKAIKADESGCIINEDAFRKAFKSKVIMYLFEDAARQYRSKLFKADICKMYSSICKEFDRNGMTIFCDDFRTAYYDQQKD